MLTPDSFSYIIKERGIDYYRQGLVTDLCISNNTFTAKVNNYDTHISFASYNCSCPCFANRENCKHLYALYLKIEDVLEADTECFNILDELDDMIMTIPLTDQEKIKIMDIGTRLLNIISRNEIIYHEEILNKLIAHEEVLVQLDTDIFDQIVSYLSEPLLSVS